MKKVTNIYQEITKKNTTEIEENYQNYQKNESPTSKYDVNFSELDTITIDELKMNKEEVKNG